MNISFRIDGAPITKKNSIRMARVKGRMIPLPSKQFIDYQKHFLRQLPEGIPHGIHTPVNVQCVYWMPTKRQVDIVNLLEATLDILVKAKVLVDDCRDIVAGHNGSMVLYNKEAPGVLVTITPMEEYEQWVASRWTESETTPSEE